LSKSLTNSAIFSKVLRSGIRWWISLPVLPISAQRPAPSAQQSTQTSEDPETADKSP